MPRKPLIRSNCNPYHVTCRVNNRESFHCGESVAWKIFSQKLKKLIEAYEVKVHAFVVMPNHFHLLITAPKEDLGVAMQMFLRSVTKTMNFVNGRTGRVFGSKYHWSMILTENHYDNVIKYIYRNPVKAKMVLNVEEYLYSTLNALVRAKRLDFDFAGTPDFPITPEENLDSYLSWLNTPFKIEEEFVIKAALRKTEFKPQGYLLSSFQSKNSNVLFIK